VELAPPAPGLRWGRRVCAGAVARGVLLRPLGDVVVLMPPLTITADEIVRMVDALVGGLDDLSADADADAGADGGVDAPTSGESAT
jgi:adenosylmethionine-8-amino-7-oxononanoate aminotransferase